jgi:hypothetical protein
MLNEPLNVSIALLGKKLKLFCGKFRFLDSKWSNSVYRLPRILCDC